MNSSDQRIHQALGIRLLLQHSAWRSPALYGAVLCFGVLLFFSLHYLGNQIDYSLARQKIAQAYERQNLTAETYVGKAFPLDSAAALIGRDQFTECEVLLSVLADSAGSDSSRSDFDRMIQPYRLRSKTYPGYDDYCRGLQSIAIGGDRYDHARLKTRYWWGFKAVYGMLLKHLSIFEIRYLMQSTIYFSYLLLAVALMALSSRTALIISPILLFGVYFSGIPYFSTVTVAPGYILSLLGGAVMALLLKQRASSRALNLAAFILGMLSIYLWLVDAHVILILTLVTSIVYFGYRLRSGPVDSAWRAINCAVAYVLGFVGCFALGQLTKAVFLGWGAVIGTATDSASFHLGRFGTRAGTGLDILPYFHDLTMLGPGFGSALTMISLLALLTAAGLSVYRSVNTRRAEMLLDLFIPLGLMMFTYLRFLFGNDDPYYAARFVFVMLALAWVAVNAQLFLARHEDASPEGSEV